MNRSLKSYQAKTSIRPPTGRSKGDSQYQKSSIHNRSKKLQTSPNQKNTDTIQDSNEKKQANQQGYQQDPLTIIQELYQRQKQCQQNGKYVEAATFKRKIQQFKEHVQKNQFQSMMAKHQKERQDIQEAHQNQMNQFNQKWQQAFQKLYAQIKKIQEDMVIRHNQQFEQQKIKDAQGFQNDRRNHFRQSATLLNLRKIQQQLAKQQNYLEAHQMQIKVQQQQKIQLQKWKRQVQYKSKHIHGTLKAKHQNQIKAMRQRVQLLVDENSKQRNRQKQKLILKYQNVMKELDYQQSLQLGKFNKNVKLSQIDKKKQTGGFGNGTSKLGSTSRIGKY